MYSLLYILVDMVFYLLNLWSVYWILILISLGLKKVEPVLGIGIWISLGHWNLDSLMFLISLVLGLDKVQCYTWMVERCLLLVLSRRLYLAAEIQHEKTSPLPKADSLIYSIYSYSQSKQNIWLYLRGLNLFEFYLCINLRSFIFFLLLHVFYINYMPTC